MKQLIFFLFLLLCIKPVMAQIEISEAKRAMSQGMLSSFFVQLPDVSEKEAHSQWKKFLKSYNGKTTYDRKLKEWTTTGAKILDLSTTTVTIYARITEDKIDPRVQTNVVLWFDTGAGFADREINEEKGKKAIAILRDYAVSTSKHQAEVTLKGEQRYLDLLQKKLKELQVEKREYQKRISSAQKTIAGMNKKIDLNKVDQIDIEEMILKQESLVKATESKVRSFAAIR